MDAPKMMAIKISRRNIDVCLAIDPQLITSFRSQSDLYGNYLVINKPTMVYGENYTGIGFDNFLVLAAYFAEDFKFIGKTANGEKGFERVRIISKPQERIMPVRAPYPGRSPRTRYRS